MERTMSVEDKIRRAEEIYNRRRQNENKVTTTRVSVENSSQFKNQNINNRLKKMIIQIVVCMLIYLTFHYIIRNDYIFSQDFKDKCEEILSYDISFSEIYKKVSEYFIFIQEKYNSVQETNVKLEEQNIVQDVINTEEKDSNTINDEVQEINNQGEPAENIQNTQEDTNINTEENIGGTVEEISNLEDTGETEQLTEEEQMKKDAEEIKAKIGFIKPLTGTITSVFGWRNPKSTTVSKYHTGIDIASNEGTDIISATNGTVQVASSKGAYGKHLKIIIEDVTIIYAHCSSLEVNEGDVINQGQIIAKVGSTGNSTGPHLHFEIRKSNRYVDPSLILDF